MPASVSLQALISWAPAPGGGAGSLSLSYSWPRACGRISPSPHPRDLSLSLSSPVSFLGPVFLSPSLRVWLGVGLLVGPSLPPGWSPTPGSLPLVGVGLVRLLSRPPHPCLGLISLVAHPPHPSLSSLWAPRISVPLRPSPSAPLPTLPPLFLQNPQPQPRQAPGLWGTELALLLGDEEVGGGGPSPGPGPAAPLPTSPAL